MTKLIVTLVLIVFLGVFLGGCRFDGSGFCSANLIDPRFDGCFGGNVLDDEITVRLNQDCDVLDGELFIGQPQNPTFAAYALSGEVKDVGFATMQGANDSTQQSMITSFLDQDENMTIRIDEEPPLGPLSRCPENLEGGNRVE